MRLPRAEVGQGITTAVAQIVAEELDARLADVDVVLEDARPELLFNQLTGGSNTVHALYGPLRSAGRRRPGPARHGRRPALGRPGRPSRHRRHRGHRPPTGARATYGELSVGGRGRRRSPPCRPRPRTRPTSPSSASRPPRIDARDIVTGRAALHARTSTVPGALPVRGGPPPDASGARCASVDDAAARAMPGVVAVTRIPTGVAVVAETFDQALAARDALAITWNPGPGAHLSDADIRSRLAAAAPPFALPPLGVADRRAHLRLRLRAPRPAGGAQLRRRRAGRPGRAVAAVEEPDRRRPDRSPLALGLPGRPGDAARRPGRRLVRAAAVLRPGDRGGPGVARRSAGRCGCCGPGPTTCATAASARPATTRSGPPHLLGQVLTLRAPHGARSPLDGSHGLGELLTSVGADAARRRSARRCSTSASSTCTTSASRPGRCARSTSPFPTGELAVGVLRARSAPSTRSWSTRSPAPSAATRWRSGAAGCARPALRAVLDKVAAAGPWGRSMPAGHRPGHRPPRGVQERRRLPRRARRPRPGPARG